MEQWTWKYLNPTLVNFLKDSDILFRDTSGDPHSCTRKFSYYQWSSLCFSSMSSLNWINFIYPFWHPTQWMVYLQIMTNSSTVLQENLISCLLTGKTWKTCCGKIMNMYFTINQNKPGLLSTDCLIGMFYSNSDLYVVFFTLKFLLQYFNRFTCTVALTVSGK